MPEPAQLTSSSSSSEAASASANREGRARRSSPCIVAVVGSTGTGKSQLAVDLAKAIKDGLVSTPPREGSAAAKAGGPHLAREAEIISADSMQVYRGLDVITNKATSEEMGGVKHHLIDFLKPGQEYQVLDFVKDASELVRQASAMSRIAGEKLKLFFSFGMDRDQVQEMHSRSTPTLPILAGGTAYYTQHLLFPGRLIGSSTTTTTATNETDDAATAAPVDQKDSLGKQASLPSSARQRLEELLGKLSPSQRATWDELLGSPPPHLPDSMDRNLLWSTLEALDPDMARRWHWKDGRKVARSLRVLGETGKRHSEWIAEQRKAEREEAQRSQAREIDVEVGADGEERGLRAARKIVFWVWCQPETLKGRLDERVDKMVERGLLDEIMALRRIAAEAEARGDGATDYTRGIYQAIGYKEFDAYLRLSPTSRSQPTQEATSLLETALGQMRASTRQYARRQTMWLRRQLIPTLLRDNELRRLKSGGEEDGASTRVYLLDATSKERWDEDVRNVAVDLLKAFIEDQPLPDPGSLPSLSEPARELITTLLSDAQREVVAVSTSGAGEGEEVSAFSSSSADDPLARNALEVCPECTRASNPQSSSSGNGDDSYGEGGSSEAGEQVAEAASAPRPFLVRKDAWKAHLGSRKHRSSLKHLARLEEKRRWMEAKAQGREGGKGPRHGEGKEEEGEEKE